MSSQINKPATPVILIEDDDNDRHERSILPMKREHSLSNHTIKAEKYERPSTVAQSHRRIKKEPDGDRFLVIDDDSEQVQEPPAVKQERSSSFSERVNRALRGHQPPTKPRRHVRPAAYRSADGTAPRRGAHNGVFKRERARPSQSRLGPNGHRAPPPPPTAEVGLMREVAEPRRFSEQEDEIIFNNLVPLMSCKFRHFKDAASKLENRSPGDVYSRFRTMKQKLIRAGLPWLGSELWQ